MLRGFGNPLAERSLEAAMRRPVYARMLADALFGEALMTQTWIAISLPIFLLFAGVNPRRLIQQDRAGNQQNRREAANEPTGRVMWQGPHDLESRDLFYGIGGSNGPPDPAS